MLCVHYIPLLMFFYRIVMEKKHFQEEGKLVFGGINWSLGLGEIPGLSPGVWSDSRSFWCVFFVASAWIYF